MLTVAEIYDDAKEIFGHCLETKLFRKITDAVQLLANKGEIDPLVGYVDLCADGQCITLPREIETVMAVNIGGRPSLGRDELFSFHLNGPGDTWVPCQDYTWINSGGFPTYRDLKCPGKLIAFLDNSADNGAKVRVFGYDDQNRPLRTQVGNSWEDGYLVPTIFGYALPDQNAPVISRITDIVKDKTVANVRLSSFDNSSNSGTLLGIFEPDETKPRYRRIRINRDCEWVRICFRRRTLDINSTNDRIFLHSRLALVLAMRAVKKYDETDLGAALQFEANATRLLTEREAVLAPPVGTPMQVNDRVGLKTWGEDDIS